MRAQIILVVDSDHSTLGMLKKHPDLKLHMFIGMENYEDDIVKYCISNRVDILLMNTSLKLSGDGIDLARKVTAQHEIPIIFINDYDSDLILFEQAKQLLPYAFLNKPIDIRSLQHAIELTFIHTQQTSGNNTSEGLAISDSYFVRIGNKLRRIKIEEIKWIMVEDKHSIIFTNELHVSIKLSLKDLVQKLPPTDFLRIHRNYIVNLNKISSIDMSHNQLMIDEKSIPISRTYRDKLMKKLKLL